MFQPQPTPFASFGPYGVTSGGLSDYTFQPTALGQVGRGGGAPSAAASAALFTSPTFHNPPSLSSNDNATNNHLPYSSRKMDLPNDLAQQEAAARDYKPDLHGPMVGAKTTSHAITEEYAKADPTYVAKTLALPQTYSHYRPIQGDGNCGWRAIGFAYFETLVQWGDLSTLQNELTRLVGLNEYIAQIGGHDPYIFEDMIDETFETFKLILQAMSTNQNALDILTQRFNDDDSANAMIYHLRLLAASYLKGNYAEYAPYMVVPDVDSYCSEWILPVNKEIDNIGIALLSNVLLKPANMILEIAYLDRSPGSEVNTHRFPDDGSGPNLASLGAVIYLLYRPDHYDILYREAIPPQVVSSEPTALQVHRATSFSHQHDIQPTVQSLHDFSTLDMSPLSVIPGFDPATLSSLASTPSAPSPMPEAYSHSPQSSWIAQPFQEALPTAQASQPSASSQQPTPTPTSPTAPMTTHPLRFSKYNYPGGLPGMSETSTPWSEPAFTTTTTVFKNSHFNVAHYNNPNFQPEEYRPDGDEEIIPAKMAGRKRSTEHPGGAKK